MRIKVKRQLSKSRNPSEHGIRLQNQTGELIQVVGDGFNLIRFDQFKIKVAVKINSSKKKKLESLEWYVHENDFYIDEIIGGSSRPETTTNVKFKTENEIINTTGVN